MARCINGDPRGIYHREGKLSMGKYYEKWKIKGCDLPALPTAGWRQAGLRVESRTVGSRGRSRLRPRFCTPR